MEVMVAVYGTLRSGGVNHHLLSGAQNLGIDRLSTICLYDLGPYPGAREEASEGIEVEVFVVDAEQFRRLDALEEYDSEDPSRGMYDRKLFLTRFGPAWLYLYNLSVQGCPRVRAGAWRAGEQPAA